MGRGTVNGARQWGAGVESKQGRDLSLLRCMFGKTGRGEVEGSRLEVGGGSGETWRAIQSKHREAGEMGSQS